MSVTDRLRRAWSVGRPAARGAVRVARHPASRIAGVAVLALVGALAAVSLFGTVHRSVGPVRASFAVQPSWHGGTEVEVPPLGRLSFASQDGPVHLRVQVQGLDLADAKSLIQGGVSGDELEKRVTADVRSIVTELVIRTVLLALAGGLVVVLLVYRRLRPVLLAVGVVVAGLGASGAIAATTWSTNAFTQPRFSGLLTSAPTLIGDLDDIPDRFDSYRRELAKLVTNVSKLYDVTSALPAGISADAIPVLWVSDIHDNPESFTVMSSLITQFKVQAVVDTGDIADHGAAAENRLFAPIAAFDVPYVYVRGNHDSLATQNYLASLPNGRVLDDGKAQTVAGIRFAGIGDPTFTPDKTVDQGKDGEDVLTKAGRTLADAIDEQTTPVDVALVHEPKMAKPVSGHVPLILDGHTHKRAHRFDNGTIEITQGSSGGAGLRTLEGNEPLPLDMSILYFDKQTRRLVATDDITLSGLGQESVSIERHRASYYTESDDGVDPTPSPPSSTPSDTSPSDNRPSDTTSSDTTPAGSAASSGR